MNVNIISRNNAAGLSVDTEIMTEILQSQGWQVSFTDYKSYARFFLFGQKHYDINIFMQWANPAWFKLARYNILIPNPEWFKTKWVPHLHKFDAIFCKTQAAVATFSVHNDNVIFTGFTSKNKYKPEVIRDGTRWLHVAGKSKLKGTDVIVETWLENPHFPHLTIVQRNASTELPSASNIEYITTYIDDDRITELMNLCEVHLCPSETEGFGHCISEAASCGAFVITTDAPPMNEIITTDRGALVAAAGRRKMKLAYAYSIDCKGLRETVNEVLALDYREQRQRNAFDYFKKNDIRFKRKIREEIKRFIAVL